MLETNAILENHLNNKNQDKFIEDFLNFITKNI